MTIHVINGYEFDSEDLKKLPVLAEMLTDVPTTKFSTNNRGERVQTTNIDAGLSERLSFAHEWANAAAMDYVLPALDARAQLARDALDYFGVDKEIIRTLKTARQLHEDAMRVAKKRCVALTIAEVGGPCSLRTVFIPELTAFREPIPSVLPKVIHGRIPHAGVVRRAEFKDEEKFKNVNDLVERFQCMDNDDSCGSSRLVVLLARHRNVKSLTTRGFRLLRSPDHPIRLSMKFQTFQISEVSRNAKIKGIQPPPPEESIDAYISVLSGFLVSFPSNISVGCL